MGLTQIAASILTSILVLPAFYYLGSLVYQVYYLSFEKRGQEALRGLAFFFGLLFVTEVILILVFGVDYRYVQAGYIERTEDPSDRRAKLLKLSTKGAKLVDDGIQERYRWMDELTGQLTTEERGKVAEALTLLTEKAREVDK